MAALAVIAVVVIIARHNATSSATSPAFDPSSGTLPQSGWAGTGQAPYVPGVPWNPSAGAVPPTTPAGTGVHNERYNPNPGPWPSYGPAKRTKGL